MRRANSAAPYVPAPAPPAKCEWCGLESKDARALVSVCEGCGRATSSRTMRAVSAAPTRRYPAFKPVPDGEPPADFDDLDSEAGPTFGPTKNGAMPPALPASAKAGGPPPLPRPAPRPAAGRPAAIPVAAVLPPLALPIAPVMTDLKLSIVERAESDTALTIPVPAKAPPRPTPSKAPAALMSFPKSTPSLVPSALSIIPAKKPVVKVEPVKDDALATADTKMAPSYRLPAVSISPIISIAPPPVAMPAFAALPHISIAPDVTFDDSYAPEPMVAANDVPAVAPPPLPTFVGLPVDLPMEPEGAFVSAASAKKTAPSAAAVLAAPLPQVSGMLAAAGAAAGAPTPKSLKSQLETVKPTGKRPAAGVTKMLPFILGGIGVGVLVVAGIVAKQHVAKPAGEPVKPVATSTAAAPTAMVTTPAVTPTAAPAKLIASAVTPQAPTPKPTAEPTALAAPAPPAASPEAKVEAPEPPSTPSGSFAGAGSLDDARSARTAGDFAKAAAIYNRLAGNPDTQIDALMGLADMARANGDMNAAKSAYIRALNAAPGYLPAALGAADAAWDLGSIEEARARYHRITERYPVRMLPPRVKERSVVGDK